MTGMIINNQNPSAVTVEHDDIKETFPNFQAACAYADTVREKRFPQWPADQIDMFPHANAFDEDRMDRIGQNGPDGLAYEGVGKEWLELYGLLGSVE
jgi:hypothetical protein